ncbi:MAG: leucine-rich repeat domain-containing protein [Verrucomicrobiaceae bacterium]|nr:leucine-rich repeat domain-containing protein [Verrucomicrobiaceae bacterium]
MVACALLGGGVSLLGMRTLYIALLALLGSGIGLEAADVSDLTYTSSGVYVTITDCNASASGILDIPDVIEGVPVRIIGDKAFLQCSRLTSITVPEGVTSIGNYTFYGCSNLTSIAIPESVTSIGLTAFRDCRSLASITIPEGVTSIGNYTFYGCSSLASITIPEGVTSIGKLAFYNCNNLSSITFLGDAPTLGQDAFSGLPEGAKIIAEAGAVGFGDSFGGIEVFYVEMNETGNMKVRVSRSGVDQVAVKFSAALGSSYSIQGSADMKRWELLESEIMGAGDYVQKIFPMSEKKRFFRILKKRSG